MADETEEESPEGWTDAYDANVPRTDMVRKGANGTTWLFAKSAEDAPGMFGAAAVGELLEKADAADQYEALVKAKYSTEQLRTMAGNGHAMPDESYPIEDAEDVHNAVHAVGRGENNSHAAIRRHVIARARALGESGQIPDTWAADGSLKAGAMAKAGGPDGSDPGSPAWEAQDAAAAQQAITQLTSLRQLVQHLAAREGQEVGAGHMDDLDDVFDLQGVDAALGCALKTLAGFAFAEQAEAGAPQGPKPAAAMAKAGPDPGDAVHDTISRLAGAHDGCAVCAGWMAGAKAQSAQQEASQPPEDANDGPAADQQAPTPAPTPMMPAGAPAVDTPEQTMTKQTAEETTAAETTTTDAAAAEADALAKAAAQKKAEKKARRAAVEAALIKASEKNDAQETQLAELRKRVAELEGQPAQGSGPAFNGAQPDANQQIASRGQQAGAESYDPAPLLKAIEDEHDPVRRSQLQQRHAANLLKELYRQGPVLNPSSQELDEFARG